ncbi:MAG: ATP-binding protein [Rhodospirillaceae bacterium]
MTQSVRIALATAAVALAVMASLGTISLVYVMGIVADTVRGEARHELAERAEAVEQRLGSLTSHLAGMAANTMFANALADSKGRETYLRPFVRDVRSIDGIPVLVAMTDYRGRVIASTDDLVPASDVSALGRRVVAEGRVRATVERRPGGHVLLLAAPIVFPNTGTAEGTLVYEVAGDAISRSLSFAPGTEISFDAAAPGDRVVENEIGGQLVFFRPVALPAGFGRVDMGLRLIRSGGGERAAEVLGKSVLLAILGAVAVFIASFAIGRRLTRRLVALEGQAGAVIRSRDFSGRFSTSGDDELSHLARALNEMMAALHQAFDERRELEARLLSGERFRRYFESNKAVQLLIDPESGRIVDANRAASVFYGHDLATLRAMSVQEINILSADDVAHEMARAQAEARVYFEFRHRLASGEIRDVEVHSGPIETESGCLLYSIVHDITARKRAEEALVRARENAEQANRAKSAFLAMMSHELRTPMTGVIGMADFLSETTLGADQRSYLDTMRTSARTLLTVLNDILDYSKIDADRLTLDIGDFDAVTLVMDTVRLFWPKAGENDCRLSVDLGGLFTLPVRGDQIRIKQVLGNLVSNAIKFTHGGSVLVRLSHAARGDRVALTFRVEDTGIGIAEADLAKLFAPFSQVGRDTSRKFGGTGLGLAISKRLAELMGGEIRATSRLGAGSVFTFSCALERGGATVAVAGVAAEEQPPSPMPMTILLAEDNAINRMIVRIGLENRGHRVTVVENGLEAYEKAAVERFDLILMDMQMPVMEGGAATRLIRELPPPYSEVPVVALTADALTEHRDAYMEAGLTGFLTKPIEWTEVDVLLAQLKPQAAPVA